MKIIKVNSITNGVLRFPNCNDLCANACCPEAPTNGSGLTLYSKRNRSKESK